jgi:hypothetical protein
MQAFLILAHEDEGALNRLARTLLDVGRVFIHIDSKSNLNVDADLIANDRINIYREIDVRWGEWSAIQATELLANSALAVGCTRLTLLSGIHFPVVSKNRLKELELDSRDYVASQVVAPGSVAGYFVTRYEHRHFYPPLLKNRLAIRAWHAVIRRIEPYLPKIDYQSILDPLTARLGSPYWSVTSKTYRDAMVLVASSPEIKDYFSKIFCSDEGYFQTIFAGVSAELVDQGTTYVKWGERGVPQALEISDIDREAAAGRFLFVRKVYSREKDLIERLESIVG